MRITLLFTILLFCNDIVAQKQNNNWCFGDNAGVSFNTATPTTFTSNIYSLEGVATISDRNSGALMFYANTLNVYNRNFNMMPNGAGVGTNVATSCAQGVQIVPFVNDTNKYYVFTLTPFGSVGRLSYSVVDMTLDGGLGDVVIAQKHVSIDTGFSEAMVITEGCNSYWLITYRKATSDFYAYQITAAGINTTPVISAVPYTHRTEGIAAMKVSPDRTRLGLVVSRGTPSDYFALHDFNDLTGQVTNGRLIENIPSEDYYGLEFSPNSDRLYVSTTGFSVSKVFQYNLNLGTTAAITASKNTVHVSVATAPAGALQMGPDSNIYVVISGNAGLSRISNANALFPNCVYTTNAIPIARPKIARFGLPQAIVHHISVKETTQRRDTSVCLKEPLVLHGRTGFSGYEWQDGSTLDSLTITKVGTYWVRMTDFCGTTVDTIVVHEQLSINTTTRDTTICADSSLVLMPSKQPTGATYLWSTGSTKKNIMISTAGVYWVQVKEECLMTVDTIKVALVDLKVSIATTDTIICPGDTILIQGSVSPSTASYVWSTGSNALSITTSEEGRYILSASFKGCNASGEIAVAYHPRMSIELGESREICDDDEIILPRTATSEQTDKYLWQDGSTGRSLKVSEAGVYYVTLSNQCQTLRDTITITTRNCKLFFPSVFSPNNDGRNDRARFIGDIANVKEYTLRIYNRWGEQVYTTGDISQGWDGNYKGQDAEVGTYFYFIKYIHLGEEQIWKGNLLLVR